MINRSRFLVNDAITTVRNHVARPNLNLTVISGVDYKSPTIIYSHTDLEEVTDEGQTVTIMTLMMCCPDRALTNFLHVVTRFRSFHAQSPVIQFGNNLTPSVVIST